MTRLQQVVEACIRPHPVKPGPQRAGRPCLISPLPCSKQALLDDLFRILERAQHPVAMQRDRAPMRLEECPKGLIARAGGHEGRMPQEPFPRYADDLSSLASS